VKATIRRLDGHPSEEDKDTLIGVLADSDCAGHEGGSNGHARSFRRFGFSECGLCSCEHHFRSPPLRARVLAGKLKIVAARYDLDDGKVTPAIGSS